MTLGSVGLISVRKAKPMEDNRSQRFVFVPFCTLSQAFHARGLVKYEWQGSIKPIIDILTERDVNIVQMPCLETFFYGFEKGLAREPAGRKHYDTPEFRSFCRSKAEETFRMISGITQNGYSVVAILGMENSPSCAVNMQYPPRPGGNEGFYTEELQNLLKQAGLQIPYIGINRRSINPTLERIKAALDQTQKMEMKL
jgi:predicted secreted protein